VKAGLAVAEGTLHRVSLIIIINVIIVVRPSEFPLAGQ